MRVAVTARRRERLDAIATATGAVPLFADASDAAAVGALFETAAQALGGAPDVVANNASQRVRVNAMAAVRIASRPCAACWRAQ